MHFLRFADVKCRSEHRNCSSGKERFHSQNAGMKKIHSDLKFSQMPEMDERMEVKKLVEANCFMPLLTFPKWSTSHLLR
jgi:hypothetical protein